MSNITIIPIILSIVLIIIGLTTISINIHFITRNKKTTNWLCSEGIIVSSRIEKSQSFTKESFEDHFKASIKYRYRMDNQDYYSEKIFYGDSLFSPYKSEANKFVDRYPEGKKVKVFVNPNNKDEAILEKGIKSNQIESIGIAVFILIVGILTFVFKTEIEQVILNLK